MRLCRNRRPRRGIVCTPYDIASLQVPFAPPQLPSLAAWYLSTTGLHTDGAASFAAASSQWLSRASSTALQATGVDFFIDCWFNTTTVAAGNGAIVSKDGGGGAGALTREYLLFRSAAQLFFFVYKAGNTGVSALSAVTLSAATWYHVLAWYDSTAGTVNISVNGETPVSTSVGAALQTPDAAAFGIGARDHGASPDLFFDGKIDDVIFAKPPTPIGALAATINTTRYAAGAGLSAKNLTAAQIAAWGVSNGWCADGPGANIVKDYIGSATLTNNNTVTYAAGQVGTASLVDGDAISQADDQSGNVCTFSQSTASKRPIYKTAIKNGLPVMRGDGASTFLAGNAASLNILKNVAGCTMFAVWKPGNTGTAQEAVSVLSTGTSTANSRFSMGTDATTFNTWDCRGRTADADASGVADGGTATNAFVLQTGICNYAAGTVAVRANGSQVGTGSLASSGNTTNTASLAAALMSNAPGTGLFCNGDLAEVVIYNRVLSAVETAQVENYLNRKWSVY